MPQKIILFSLFVFHSFVCDEKMGFIQVDTSRDDVDNGFGNQQLELDARSLERRN